MSLTPEEPNRLHESNQEMETSPGLKTDATLMGPKQLEGPRASTRSLAQASKAGRHSEVKQFLEQKEREIRIASQRKSLPQVASSLRS